MKHVVIQFKKNSAVAEVYKEVSAKLGFSYQQDHFMDALWFYLSQTLDQKLSVEVRGISQLQGEAKEEAEYIYIMFRRANLKYKDVTVFLPDAV